MATRRIRDAALTAGLPSSSMPGDYDGVEVKKTGADLPPMPRRRKSLDCEAIIAAGENQRGFTAQTPNGTAHAMGTGWSRRGPWTSPEDEPDPTRPTGRSNRTAE